MLLAKQDAEDTKMGAKGMCENNDRYVQGKL